MTWSPRRLLGFNLLSAVVLGVVGYYLGWWARPQITAAEPRHFGDTSQDDVAIFLAYVLGAIGFLAGLGFLNYPLARMAGRPPSLGEERRPARPVAVLRPLALTTRSSACSTWSGSASSSSSAGSTRCSSAVELLRPTRTSSRPGNYLTLVGLHGTMMMGMMTSGILGPFANYFVPLMIGARRMAFPRSRRSRSGC